jgi:O-methyltransferase
MLDQYGTASESGDSPAKLYLNLIKNCLTRYGFGADYEPYRPRRGSLRWYLAGLARNVFFSHKVELMRLIPFESHMREEGRDWPRDAETMIGLKRLDNLEHCIIDVLRTQVPGDLIETGVWRGGATIFMRAVLKAYRDTTRTVWAADSFQGLPKPNSDRYPSDAGDRHWVSPQLAVSLEQVQANFSRYGLLDNQVRFLVGWFRDTLPTVPADRFAVIRLDGDMYESTMDALQYLYPKLSIGGYAIIDDYGAVPACKAAVEDFRAKHGILEKLEPIDWTGVFWKRLHRDREK